MTQTSKTPFQVVMVGHVDHGKSTLIGRLLHDTDSLQTGQLEALHASSAKRGEVLEWSYLLDALQIERDQGITVDTTRIWFKTPARDYVIIDSPGHAEFLRNMVTGASGAQAAVLLVDAERGVSEQTRRHVLLLSLLGVKQVVVAVNKMDLVGYAQAAYARIARETAALLAALELNGHVAVPLSARHGDMIADRGDNLGWWPGPTLLEALDALQEAPKQAAQPLRLPVQDVYRTNAGRWAVGRVEAGALRVGDTVRIAPGGSLAVVAELDRAGDEARAGHAVAVRFAEDHQLRAEPSGGGAALALARVLAGWRRAAGGRAIAAAHWGGRANRAGGAHRAAV
jgi:bifunctional enzyme CysN/CysC